MTRHRDVQDLEDAYAVLHNCCQTLLGNTQETDLEWFARVLFDGSNLGVGDIATVPWILGAKDWEEVKLRRQQLMGDGPRRWDHLTAEQQEAWRKLARVCLWCLPAFCDRVGNRFAEQAKALELVWRQQRQRPAGEGGAE